MIMNLQGLSLSTFWGLRSGLNSIIKQAQDNCALASSEPG